MKRTRIMGLCVMAAMAAFAMSAIAASSASAGTYYTCSAQKKGEYTNSTCTTKDAKAKKGTYELVVVSPCVAQKKGNYTEAGCKTVAEKKGKPDHKGKYETATKLNISSVTGAAKLETPELGGTVSCTASTGTGELTGGKTATDVTTFTGCETKGAKCESAGEPEGTIKTLLLETTLIDNGEKAPDGSSPLAGEVWTLFKGTAADGGVQAVFGCAGVGYFETTGTLVGVDGGVNTPSTTGTLNFELGLGEQGLKTEVSSGPEFKAGETLGPFASTERVKATVTYEKVVDVKS
jgi:hypothetical protein